MKFRVIKSAALKRHKVYRQKVNKIRDLQTHRRRCRAAYQLKWFNKAGHLYKAEV